MRNLILFMALLLGVMIFAAFSMTNASDFDYAKQEILLRKIGHDILLQSGDSTSRVLPIEKVSADEYRISFENAFTFKADSLVSIISRSLDKSRLSGDYVVNVLNLESKGVIFGYAISEDQKDNIMACCGRIQPKRSYVISIKFKSEGLSSLGKSYLLGGLPFVAFVGFIFTRKRRTNREDHHDVFHIGNILFDPQKRLLTTPQSSIKLTGTETRLLIIFSRSPNEVVERARLQKEIWEDEGVIVGRSLDMFVSKLRKKLACDPDIELVNIHGRGYKLVFKL